MLSLEQIMELQEKGFTWDQIATVNNTLGKPTPEPEPEAKPEPEPEAKPEPEPEAKPEPKTEDEAVATLTAKIDEMAATIKEIQETNVKKAEHDPPAEMNADSIIKSFMEAS